MHKKAWDAFARPCQAFSEYLEENVDKVYCSCKESRKVKEIAYE